MVTPRTLPEALDDAAESDSGFSFQSGTAETSVSYEEIRRRSLQVARALKDAGLRRGDLAALVLPDGEQFLTALFGASIARLLPASVYPPATAADLPRYIELTAGILNAAEARAVVTTRTLAAAFADARAMCPHLSLVLCREDLDAAPDEPNDAPSPGDIAFVQYTSGSTSMPKGVALTHANLAANIDAFAGPSGVAVDADDVAVSWLPLNHDMGLVGMVLGALYTRRSCVLLTPQTFVKRPAEWLRAVTRHRGTISFAPSFAYDLCVRRVKDLAGLDLSSWRVAGCGAEPVHPAALAAFAEKFAPVGFRSTSFLPCYGLAEHVLAATFPPRDRGVRIECVAANELADRRVAVDADDSGGPSTALVSCGSVLPGHQLVVADEHGTALPERHVGEIRLAGPSVMVGYYKQGALTDEVIRDGWLRTGDLGYLSRGELFVCGRVRDLIIVHGRKYHPQDLEWAVDDVSGVRRGRVVAFGVESDGADRVVIVAEAGGTVASGLLVEEIRKRIGDLFGLYVDEVAVVPSGTVGRTTSGKVQRAATKERYVRGEWSVEGTRA
ncbi:MAG TPA: fatty acyl-AMP ligase [Vicinamibacterales bacterium]|nr:fatty acyl-AMP ligase [Vicinamibacterales bacterium]